MPNYLKPFVMGVIFALFVVYAASHIFEPSQSNSGKPDSSLQPGYFSTAAVPSIPKDAVKIQPLPSLRILSGIKVDFKGKTELPQVIAGRYAKSLTVAHFSATGENAHKSVIKIVWADGTTDTVPAGTYDRVFPAEKRAKQITVAGYSMYERRILGIFGNSAKPGTLTWEIKYLPVED